MALVTSKEMFRKAYDGGYAIGAFNVNNMAMARESQPVLDTNSSTSSGWV